MGETVYSRVKLLCKEKGVTVAQMERDMGFPRGNAYKWQQTVPSVPALNKLSAYFGKPISYILKGIDTAEEHIEPIDLKTEINRLVMLIEDSSDITFAGKQLSDLSKKILADSLQHTISIADTCQDA